jgi:hypothetical protein
MLIDLLATMARLDNDKRRERIKQGLEEADTNQVARKLIRLNMLESKS